MADTPDFSAFTWSNSQQSGQAETADPSSYSQHTSYDAQPRQGGDAYSSRDSALNGAAGQSSTRDSGSSFTFTFGQPTSQTGSQSGYYNGAVETSQPGFGGSDGSGYTPIDPALTAPPPRTGASSFTQGQSSQQASGDSPYLSTHLPPTNFNPARRYSTPALSSSATPYTIPHRQNMYPPSYSQRQSDTSPFAQPQPRSPAFSTPVRSTQISQGYTGNPLDRRMSMPTN